MLPGEPTAHVRTATRLPSLGLVVCESEPGVWCVYEARFVGQEPEARARDYYNAIRVGRSTTGSPEVTTILNRAHEISSAALIDALACGREVAPEPFCSI